MTVGTGVTNVDNRSRTMPAVTVYIVCRNYARFLGAAIESVLRQAYDDWELLVIDDGSTDHTPQVMELYRGDLRLRFLTTEGIGLPRVCNVALRNAQGRYLIRLDADDVLDENSLLVLSNYLDRHPDIALVFPDYFLMDESGYVYAQERRQPIFHMNHMLDMPPNGACTMVRKVALESVGGYREDVGAQDGLDLWNKITQRYKCANVNVPLFYYRRHAESLTTDIKRILAARRKIKRAVNTDTIEQYRPITAIIPCRRYYDFCTDLWSAEVDGQTLLDIALQRCLALSVFDRIVVTSDNPDAKDVVAQYQDPRLGYVARSQDSTIRSRTVAHTLEHVVKATNGDFDGLTVLSVIEAPLVTPETVEEAIYSLPMNEADSAILVDEVDSPLFERTAHGLMRMNYKGFLISDFEVIYADTRACLVTKTSNLRTGSLTGSKVVGVCIPKDEALWIRNERDLEFVRFVRKQAIAKSPVHGAVQA